MAKRIIFSVTTPLGECVTLTRDRWREIVRYKHPALAGQEAAVKECLMNPAVVRASGQDETVHLYYHPLNGKRFVCVVIGGENPGARFVITAYFTDKIKKGVDLWTR